VVKLVVFDCKADFRKVEVNAVAPDAILRLDWRDTCKDAKKQLTEIALLHGVDADLRDSDPLAPCECQKGVMLSEPASAKGYSCSCRKTDLLYAPTYRTTTLDALGGQKTLNRRCAGKPEISEMHDDVLRRGLEQVGYGAM
jgi:hypothetical protein